MRKAVRIKLAKEIVEQFPKSSKKTLAEKLYNRNKELFKDMEDAR